ncbi:uncharacterized protein LOC121601989 [Anopheles merus]|uniref:uncharacterized protein LOC121601989 n=1 Tax=Anopheles merus TaxID=30066 RepID=UPI001BE48FCC|nr:uncharacterized protein LOC121601989 [Anopheles merus]
MSGTPKDQKRSSVQRASKIQQQKLLDIMEQNPEVARGTAKNSQTSFWDDLAIQLNALGPPSKSGKEWLRAWIEKKYITKRKITENKKTVEYDRRRSRKFSKNRRFRRTSDGNIKANQIVAPAPDSICIEVPEELQEVEPLPLQQKSGTSKSVHKCSTDIYEPAKKEQQ